MLAPVTPIALRPGEQVGLILVRLPDPSLEPLPAFRREALGRRVDCRGGKLGPEDRCKCLPDLDIDPTLAQGAAQFACRTSILTV